MPSQSTTPQPGQVWRAQWDDVLTFVLIDAVLCEYATRVRVAPVSLGDETADETAVILTPETNSLELSMSIWPEMTTEISALVLEKWITAISGFDSLSAIEQAADDGSLLRGLPVLNDSSPRVAERRLLELAIGVLASATFLPAGTGELASLLTDLPSSELSAALEVPLALARSIKRARALIDATQAERLSQVVRRPADDLLHANPSPPAALLESASRIERGPDIRALARARGTTDSEAFINLVQGAWGLAARGDRVDAEDWTGRLDTYLHVALAAR